MSVDPDRLETQPRQGGERADHIRRTPNRLWACIIVIILGFVAGGLGLILRQWWLIAVGVATIVLGGIAAKAFGIMENTE
jgi:ABC-type Mn2+/Zn2+ transport system permease subunit